MLFARGRVLTKGGGKQLFDKCIGVELVFHEMAESDGRNFLNSKYVEFSLGNT
jgi:hypothetical protein